MSKPPAHIEPAPRLQCSIIVPVYNAAAYLPECLQSIIKQKAVNLHTVQLVLYDDSSTDNSFAIAESYKPALSKHLGDVILLKGTLGPLGVGSARNRACEKARSPIFIFQDADDIMRERRVAISLAAFRESSEGSKADVIGGVFDRIPEGSTPRYEDYHRRLSTSDLFAHAFRDASLAFPTVACRRHVWDSVRFVEGRGVPEDLHFLYGAMEREFRLVKMSGESVTSYRFHGEMTSLSLHRRMLLTVRVEAFERLVLKLPGWRSGFSIWNSGRDGKEVYKRLSVSARGLVREWGDVDPRKIGTLLKERRVVHFSELKAPIACCVVLDREGREFEANLASLQLEQGKDYVHLV